MNFIPPVLSNRTAITALLFLFFCMLFASCRSNSSTDIKEIEETLRRTDASIQKAIAQKNIDSLMLFYAEDAFLLPTAKPIVKGKEEIRKEWQHIFQIPDFTNQSTLTKIEISKDGSMAYTMGSYLAIMQGEDENVVQEPGKWVTVWKKQSDEKWQIVVDTYNTDIPPPDHK